MLAFRWLVIACQAATIWVTWPLWDHHTSPPMLPAAPLPSFDIGLPLLATLVITLFAPFLGMVLNTVVLLYAFIVDQTRIQPEVVSLAFLMWGTLASPTAQGFARAHLIALWVFAGVNKLVSPAFLTETAQMLLDGLVPHTTPWLHDNIGYIIAGTELSTGLFAIFPRTRKLAAVMAFGLHAGILLDLSPLGLDRNISVWPWNLALAFAGFALIGPWKESVSRSLAMCQPVMRPLILLVALAPIGYHVGVTDAYMSHNLYSSNIPRAYVSCQGGCIENADPSATWLAFNVPLPPERHIYEQYFDLTCRPGNDMLVVDPRWWFERQGLGQELLTCPTGKG